MSEERGGKKGTYEGNEVVSLERSESRQFERTKGGKRQATHDGEPREDELDSLVHDEQVKEELPDEGVVASVEVVCERGGKFRA